MNELIKIQKMQELTNLNSEKTYSSTFLVEQVNLFRKKEGNKKELLHKNLLTKIEKRFQSKIAGLKILPSSYLAIPVLEAINKHTPLLQ